MKRVVAVLLGMAMLLSVSCKGTKDSSNDPDISDSGKAQSDGVSSDKDGGEDGSGAGDKDGTDGSGSDASRNGASDGSGASGGSGDPDQTDPANKPSGQPVEVTCARDLTRLDAEVYSYSEVFYPKEITDDDYTLVEYDGEVYRNLNLPTVFFAYDLLKVEGEEYAPLQSAVDAIVDAQLEKARAEYEAECKALEEMDTPDYDSVGYSSQYFDSFIQLYRADSMVLSFSCGDEIYNLDAKTGERITLSDVVLDKVLFEELLNAYVGELHYSYNDEEDKANDEKFSKIRHEQIENDTLPFVLEYDGLSLHLDDEESFYYYNVGQAKISAMTDPEIFNMEYFGHTPEYYTLQSNVNGWIYWDFNGDGKLDYYGSSKTNDYANELGFTDLSCGLYEGDLVTADVWVFTNLVFLQSDDGKYLYIDRRGAVMSDDLSILPVEGDLDYVNDILEPFDPALFVTRLQLDFLGLQSMYRDYSFMAGKGLASPVSVFYSNVLEEMVSKVSIPAVKVELTAADAGLVPRAGHLEYTEGEEITIPKGSTFDILEYDREANLVLFRITPPGASVPGSGSDAKGSGTGSGKGSGTGADSGSGTEATGSGFVEITGEGIDSTGYCSAPCSSEDYYVIVEYIPHAAEDPEDYRNGGTLGGYEMYDVFDNLPQYGG